MRSLWFLSKSNPAIITGCILYWTLKNGKECLLCRIGRWFQEAKLIELWKDKGFTKWQISLSPSSILSILFLALVLTSKDPSFIYIFIHWHITQSRQKIFTVYLALSWIWGQKKVTKIVLDLKMLRTGRKRLFCLMTYKSTCSPSLLL